jgi:hypothetical protein
MGWQNNIPVGIRMAFWKNMKISVGIVRNFSLAGARHPAWAGLVRIPRAGTWKEMCG